MRHSSPLVFKVHQYGKTSSRVVFFFCPFGIPSWLLALPGLPIWQLRRHGYHVVSYSYKPVIATGTPQVTVANIQAIQADAYNRIALLGSNVEVFCFGTSLGTVLAVNVAASTSRVEKVVLNLSYADISEHIIHLPGMWSLPRKRVLVYINQAGSQERLKQIFLPYSPLSLAGKLHGKRVLLFVSKSDRVLKYQHTAKLRQELRNQGMQLEYYENVHGSHYFAALSNYIRAQRYLDFLARD